MAWYIIVIIVLGVILITYLSFIIHRTLHGGLVSWDNTFMGFLQAVHYVSDYYLIKWKIKRPISLWMLKGKIKRTISGIFEKVCDKFLDHCDLYVAIITLTLIVLAIALDAQWLFIFSGIGILFLLLEIPVPVYKKIWCLFNPVYRKREMENQKRSDQLRLEYEEWREEAARRQEEIKRQDEENHYHEVEALRIYKTLPFSIEDPFPPTYPFQKPKRLAIYYEPTFNASINSYIDQHYKEICEGLGDGILFVYPPKMLIDIQSVIKYNHPESEQYETRPYQVEDFYNVIRKNIVKIPTENPMLIITDYNNTAGFPPDMLDDTMFGCYFFNLEYINDEQFSYCLNKNIKSFNRNNSVFYSVRKLDKELWADYSQVDTIAKEIRERINHLYAMGVSDYIIKQIVSLPEPKLSHLLIDEDHRIFLPDYQNIEIAMPTLSKVLFFFYLRHPEGVMFKGLRDHIKELSEIYRTISPREDMDKMESSIKDLVDSTKNSVNEKRSRIKAAFISHFNDELARNYYIIGKGWEMKTITLDRSLIIDKSGIIINHMK